MMQAIEKNKSALNTELVILAGGQAQRMNGVNKLLQQFDGKIQLSKICVVFRSNVATIWVNSHRDQEIYTNIEPDVRCYSDDEQGFYGPLMGMKSAWRHVKSEYLLFIPCDITFIPTQVLSLLHQALQQYTQSKVAYVSMNGDALYPFCLVHQSAYPIFKQQLAENKLSLRGAFKLLNAVEVAFQQTDLIFHSINSLSELEQYQQ